MVRCLRTTVGCLGICWALVCQAETAHIAIIIDDLGYNLDRGSEALAIPAKLTYSILPNSTYGTRLAKQAHRANKEIMVHLPMESSGIAPAEQKVLTRSLRKAEFLATLRTALLKVPHARGINNHMGSALTPEPRAMNWLMQAMKKRGLYFVDSRTTKRTVAYSTAREIRLPAASRDVFLDNDRSMAAIDREFKRLLQIAERNGSAVAIGHPHPATLEYLRLALPDMKRHRLLPVSELIMLRDSWPQLSARVSDRL